MKKFAYIAIAALALAACSRENLPENDLVPDNMVKVSFTATLDQADLTKAEISLTSGDCSWEAGDAIAVHTTGGNLVELTAESAGTSVTFSGLVPTGDSIDPGAIAYYPASIAKAGDATVVTLPDSYASPAKSAKGFLLRGVLDGTTISFKHIGAIMKLTVNEIPSNVDALVISAPNKNIKGELAVDVTNADEPKCVVSDNTDPAGSSVTISSAAADRSSSTVFCIPMPTGTLTGGFSIKLMEGTTVVGSKTTTSDVAIGRAKLVKMKAFTPEGAVSEWSIPGGFNSWSTTATPMTSVVGHDGWLVARNINITPVSGQDAGFKFFKSADNTWEGGSCSALHTQYAGDPDAYSSNITFTNGTYDIYYNPTTNKFFLANAGESWIYKTVHLMSDIEFDDLTYYLHVWPASGAGLTTSWPGIVSSGSETISGIKYYKFDVAICDGDFTSNSYNCVFHTNDGVIRYDFRDGALTADAVNSNYYASFTSTTYKGDHGENNTNPMTQFTDPAKPKGSSNWGVFVNGNLSKMHWDESPWLVYKNYVIGPDTELKLNFNYAWRFYGPSTATVTSDGTAFSVSQSNTDVFKVSDLTENYLCDVYLNIFEKKAKIVARDKENATITLYFGVPNPGTWVRYYTFNGRSMNWNLGIDEEGSGKMTDFVTFNDVKYYKAVLPGKEFWDTNVALIVRSDGIADSQTHDFTTADWSGHLDEYYFLVVGKDIIQQTEAEAKWTFTSQFSGVDWSAESWLGSSRPGYLADWKVTSDATNLYFLFKIPASGVKASRYIYSGYNTDNDSTTGDDAGGGVNGGYEAMSLLFPFTTDSDSNVVCKNGTDSEGKVQTPVGTTISGVKPVTYGVIRSDYAYVEMMIPRSAIGSPTGTIGIQHSYNWGEAGEKAVVLN